jgi:hypothetical protein
MRTDQEKREDESARVRELARETESTLIFVSEVTSLTRRIDCCDHDCRYSGCKDLLFRLVEMLAELARETLARIPKEQSNDLPF